MGTKFAVGWVKSWYGSKPMCLRNIWRRRDVANFDAVKGWPAMVVSIGVGSSITTQISESW